MIVDLTGVESKKYIKQEASYTLKCIAVREAGFTSNQNPIIKFHFQNKNEELYIEDVVLTPDTRFRIKQMADAFGFEYNKVNIYHFIGMYLVGYLAKETVTNKNGDKVEVLRCKQFSKSAKLVNTIPPEGSTPTAYESKQSAQSQNIPEIDIDEEIPFNQG